MIRIELCYHRFPGWRSYISPKCNMLERPYVIYKSIFEDELTDEEKALFKSIEYAYTELQKKISARCELLYPETEESK